MLHLFFPLSLPPPPSLSLISFSITHSQNWKQCFINQTLQCMIIPFYSIPFHSISSPVNSLPLYFIRFCYIFSYIIFPILPYFIPFYLKLQYFIFKSYRFAEQSNQLHYPCWLHEFNHILTYIKGYFSHFFNVDNKTIFS